jgi:hypothetical protein
VKRRRRDTQLRKFKWRQAKCKHCANNRLRPFLRSFSSLLTMRSLARSLKDPTSWVPPTGPGDSLGVIFHTGLGGFFFSGTRNGGP